MLIIFIVFMTKKADKKMSEMNIVNLGNKKSKMYDKRLIFYITPLFFRGKNRK